MLAVRTGMIVATLLLLAFTGPNAAAQQSGQRRVLTNEDVARPAPAPAAESPEQKAPAAEAAKASPSAIPPGSAPKSELQRAMELQAFLRDAIEEFNEKYANETIEARKMRWDTMVTALNTLIQYNQLRISELQEPPAGSTPAAQTAP